MLKLTLTPTQKRKLERSKSSTLPVRLYVKSVGDQGGEYLPDATLSNPLRNDITGGSDRRNPEDLYEEYLDLFEEELGKEVTKESDLLAVGKEVLGDDFVGVFARGELPQLQHSQMALMNLDRRSEGGSHWVGAVGLGGSRVLYYDSFARKLFDDMTQDDAEQKSSEDNCGPRSLAFLAVYNIMGESAARAI